LVPVAFAQKPKVVDAPGWIAAFQESALAVTVCPDWLLVALQKDVIVDWFRLMTVCHDVVAVLPVLLIVTLAQ
jgi:hypothetical protein